MELNIGEHCNFTECHQLDFLPIQCLFCLKQFCKIHSKASDHDCETVQDSRTLSKEEVEKLNAPASFTCSMKSCQGRELTPILCDDCEKQFCLKHRLPVDHGCECIQIKKKSEFHGLTAQEKVEKITGKVLASDKTVVGRVGKKSSKTSSKVLEMKLKMKSKGENSIPVDERVYFDVKINVAGHPIKSALHFFSREFSVGRTIDLIAKYTKLKNENHVACAPKLRLYVTDSEYFPVDVKLGTLISNEANELNNFGELYIKYVS